MSSMNRPLTGPLLTFNLEEQLREMRGDEAYRHGRVGRTLAKSGRLRVLLVAVTAGHGIGTHQAESPMTVQVLQGHIRFRADGDERDLSRGDLLFFGPGDAHDIRATEDSALLITLSAVDDDFLMEHPDESEAPQRGPH